MPFAIGHKIWSRGEEATITTEPYEMHGGQWQDAETESGKTVTVPTPEYKDACGRQLKADWREQQRQFRNLRKQREAR